MQCKKCGTELPKHAVVCPKCGEKTGKEKSLNVRVLAVAGLVLAFIGGLLPFVQNVDTEASIGDAYSFMNIQVPAMWYLFIAAIAAGLILLALKRERLSLIPTAIAAVIFIVSFCGMDFGYRVSKSVTDPVNLLSILSNGYDGQSYAIGFGFFVVVIGLIVGIAGVFFDIVALFKKPQDAESLKYMSNSINKNLWAQVYYYRWFYLMFLPVLIFLLLFNYWPMLGVRYAFTRYMVRDPYYVGIRNFASMVGSDAIGFWGAFRNTMFLSLIKLVLNTGAAVIISLLLNEITNLLFKKSVQTIVYLPHFMSWVVVASIFRMILSANDSGMFNQLLRAMGILGANDNNIFWLGDTNYWTGAYFFINIWKDTGWGTILFLATLSGISPDLYEAAQIDGANRWKRLCYITFPALANTIITVFILNLAKVMNLFESVFVLQNPATYDVSQVLQTYIYYRTFGAGTPDYGYTTAVGLFKSFVSVILVLGCNYASKKVRGRGIV